MAPQATVDSFMMAVAGSSFSIYEGTHYFLVKLAALACIPSQSVEWLL